MGKFITYKVLQEQSLIVEYYRGKITAEDLINIRKIVKDEPNYVELQYAVHDFRDCILEIDEIGLTKMIEFLCANFKKDANRKIAYITSDPTHVVLTTLYTEMLNDTGFDVKPKIFSTIEATAKYFNNIIPPNLLVDVINELQEVGCNVVEAH